MRKTCAPVGCQQRGVVLIIALIMLVGMTLVGVSLLRSIGSGAGIAGNLAFKQSATSAADLGVEVARTWLTTTGALTPAVLEADVLPRGYYSTWDDLFNPVAHNWANSARLTSAETSLINAGTGRDSIDNEVRYVLHRLCQSAGVVSPIVNVGQRCANVADLTGRGSKGGPAYGAVPGALDEQPYYRVTVRVRGPRNTLSFTQVIMH